ncbi:MAG TPA: type I restriction enzyme HsdR N-terminal domain-containing protein [Rhodothermales bacterium]
MHRYPLNLPEFEFAYRTVGETRMIFDPIRRKYVALTPEEGVRQRFIQHLLQDLQYPPAMIAVEVGFTYQRMPRRADVVAYGRAGRPLLVAECKAPDVPLTQQAFDQIARYNTVLGASILAITNGLEHYACAVDASAGTVSFLNAIPTYKDIATP